MVLTIQQRYDRQKHIGGSDVAAIHGLDPYRTPVDVYLEKTGQSEGSEENEAMEWGTILEPVIIDKYSRKTGLQVITGLETIYDAKDEVLCANLDGVVPDNRVVEAKTSGVSSLWGEEGTDEVPDNYACQVQHYMGITGLKKADICVLIGGNKFRTYTVNRNEAVIKRLREGCLSFWYDNVLKCAPPDPTTGEDAIKLYPVDDGSVIEADELAIMTYNNLKGIREQLKMLKVDEEEMIGTLKTILGAKSALISCEKPIITWKSAKDSVKVDYERAVIDIIEAVPENIQDIVVDILNKHTATIQGSRRFLLK